MDGAKVGNGTASIPTPIVNGDYVFCSSGYGTGSALLHLSKAGSGVKAEEVYFKTGNEFQNVLMGGLFHKRNFFFCIK